MATLGSAQRAMIESIRAGVQSEAAITSRGMPFEVGECYATGAVYWLELIAKAEHCRLDETLEDGELVFVGKSEGTADIISFDSNTGMISAEYRAGCLPHKGQSVVVRPARYLDQ